MADEYIRRQDAVGAVEFGITLASAINIETGEWTELFQRENDELRKAVERIKDIEPADVVPVVHGRWVNGRCDKCGEHAPFWSMASTYYESDFCPNCGAYMKGKEER